jgi:hypothetical protein
MRESSSIEPSVGRAFGRGQTAPSGRLVGDGLERVRRCTSPRSLHEATQSLLDGSLSPSAGHGEGPFALDVEARLAALERTHAFDNVEHRTSAWSLALDPDQTVALYATYSNINIRRTVRPYLPGCVVLRATSSTAA